MENLPEKEGDFWTEIGVPDPLPKLLVVLGIVSRMEGIGFF